MSKKKENKKFTFEGMCKRVCDFVKNHWIVSAILLNGCSLWFPLILGFWGEKAKLIEVIIDEQTKTASQSLTTRGYILTAVVLIITVILTVIQKYNSEHLNYKELKTGYNLLDSILIQNGKICDKKANTQIKKIESIKEKTAKPEKVFTAPCEQFKAILDCMRDCLISMLSEDEYKFSDNEVHVCLAYNFPLENKDIWHWTDNNRQKGLPIEDLIKAPDSTFSRLLKLKKPYLFFNSKEEAREKGYYVIDDSDQTDREGKLKGSIACYRIALRTDNNTYIKAVLSIATYNKKFSKVDDEKSVEAIEYNMYESIFNSFEKQLKVELCNFYMQYLYKEEQKKSTSTTP